MRLWCFCSYDYQIFENHETIKCVQYSLYVQYIHTCAVPRYRACVELADRIVKDLSIWDSIDVMYGIKETSSFDRVKVKLLLVASLFSAIELVLSYHHQDSTENIPQTISQKELTSSSPRHAHVYISILVSFDFSN